MSTEKTQIMESRRNVFSARLKQRREDLGLTQPALAHQLGKDEQGRKWKTSRISNYEQGTTEPDLPALCQIAIALKTSIDSLVGLRSADFNPGILTDISVFLIEAEQTLATARSTIDAELGRAPASARKLKEEALGLSVETALRDHRGTSTADLGSSGHSDATGVKRVSGGDVKVGRSGKTKNRQT